jgi:AcrR family transcriptional regulator
VAERKAGEPAQRLRRLQGGRHHLSAELVSRHQHERLLAAMAELCAQYGYNAVTITQITEVAEVSRRTFYEHFEGKEECFLAAYDVLDQHFASLIAEAREQEEGWVDQVAEAFAKIIGYFASHPNFARLYLVEGAAVGDVMLSRREAVAERFIALLRPGREQGRPEEPRDGIDEALVGGIFTLLGRRVVAGEGEELDRFIPAVLEFAFSPYLGAEAAREVASRYA